MKAIIISDADARALLDKLELKKMREENHMSRGEETEALRQAHSAFHYIVCRWLQEMGADVVPR